MHAGCNQGRIQGGHGGPMPPPFGTEQALNTEVYHALSGRSYSDTAHISIMNHCSMSCKHKALKSAAPRRQFCGSASYTKADSEGKGLRETTIR